MPRKGYSQVTVTDDLKGALLKEARRREVSVPVLFKQFLANPSQPPAGETTQIGWISPRVARIILYASKVFNKTPKDALEKLVSMPAKYLNGHAGDTRLLIGEGVQLVKDLNPDEAKKLQLALKEIAKKTGA